ncbi:MAG: hypothetical protein QOG15_983 [Solirubrobacteraceae bacterium]|nr:hypothetical protein [Solirubrobacteraceae bacterium]
MASSLYWIACSARFSAFQQIPKNSGKEARLEARSAA